MRTRALEATVNELRQLITLAIPLMTAQAGNQVMGLVDTAMVGRLGAAELSGVGVGNSLYFALTLVALGCLLGADPVLSQAVGANDLPRVRLAYRAGSVLALALAVPTLFALLACVVLLPRLGVDATTAGHAQAFLMGRGPGTVLFLYFINQRSVLQAFGLSRRVLLATLVANIVNLVANGLLIFGDRGLASVGLPSVGLPALGVLGSGLSSSLANLASVVALAPAVRQVVGNTSGQRVDRSVVRTILFVGTPLGIQLLAEVGIFTIASILASRMGQTAGAAHQVAIALASLTFTLALGLSAAASVRVGLSIGEGRSNHLRVVGGAALVATTCIMGTTAAGFIAMPRFLASAMTTDAGTFELAIPLLFVAAAFQLSDGFQAVASGLLRGAGDTRVPLRIVLSGYYVVGLPTAVLLAYPLRQGVTGLWWGLCAGLTTVGIGLSARFFWLTRTPIPRLT